MRKAFLMVILFVLVLAACSSQPEAAPTPAAVATELPDTGSVTTNENPAPASGATTYKIVPGESTLTYEVGEVFLNDNNRINLAVGVTGQVTGEITVDPANPAGTSLGEFSADINQFKSDSNRRDSAVRTRFLNTDKFPNVIFKPTAIDGLPAAYTAGQAITFKITGDVTIREVTRPVTFDVTAQLADNSLTGEAVTTILMSDFGFGPISIAGILKTEDEAKMTLEFVARP